MEISSSSDSSRSGLWEDDSNLGPRKKVKHSATVIGEDDAQSLTTDQKKLIITYIPESDRWVATGFLGKGSYGSVYLAESIADGDGDSLPYEMVIKSNDVAHSSSLKKEEGFLTRLQSPFVVSCYGHEITQERRFMYYNTILEYCPGHCLAQHIKGRRLPEEDAKGFACDILFGLMYIHGQNIIHCDIKPENIFLVPENTRIRANGFAAKISGFGKAVEEGSIGSGEAWRLRRAMTRFSSPELIGDLVLDRGADVWAFGCTVLEMLTGERVWVEQGELDREGWMNVIGESDLVPCVPHSLSENAKDFLSKCLERDPALRWYVDRLIKHPFLRWNHQEEEEEEEEVEDEEALELEEEEVEEMYDGIGDADVEAWLQGGQAFQQEEEAIEIDEEYPVDEDSEEDL